MKTLQDILAELPEERRDRIKARTAELIAEEMTLRDLRKAMAKTQVEIARALDIGQEGVSRLEKRTDMLLSTLNSYVKAMGGELNLVATFPGRAPVLIEALADVSEESGAVEAVDAAE